MSMLKKAENKMAYAKVGLYGDAGSGKTFTAAQIAVGLHQFAELKKPVAMFDTEPAASFIIPIFEQAGIDFYVYDESRALKDLMSYLDETEEACSILLIDSITHIWRKLQQDYLDAVNQTRKNSNKRPLVKLEFQHWGPIKEKFGKFTDRFLSSKLHCIVCGRAGSIYEYQENEQTGKKELITVGTKMASEKEMGYEPSLLIEMSKLVDDGKLINQAFVEKDRANRLNGRIFNFPTFESFLPHFQALNLGGQHGDSMERRSSVDMFDGTETDDGFGYEKRQREIWCEEIEGLLVKHYPSQTATDKAAKANLIEQVFNTRSWTLIQNKKSEDIKAGFLQMKAIIEPPTLENQESAQ